VEKDQAFVPLQVVVFAAVVVVVFAAVGSCQGFNLSVLGACTGNFFFKKMHICSLFFFYLLSFILY